MPMFTEGDPFHMFVHFKLIINAKFFKRTEEVKLYTSKQRLAWKVQQTFDFYKHQLKTFQEILKVLEDRLAPSKYPSEVMSSFWLFTQPPSMNVSEYLAQDKLKVKKMSNLQIFLRMSDKLLRKGGI